MIEICCIDLSHSYFQRSYVKPVIIYRDMKHVMRQRPALRKQRQVIIARFYDKLSEFSQILIDSIIYSNP